MNGKREIFNGSPELHVCHFYKTKEELIGTLISYFHKGLRNNELCVWITSPPLSNEEAKSSLKAAVPDLEDYIAQGQMIFVPYDEWYLEEGELDCKKVMKRWIDTEQAALSQGFEGIRVTGDTLWAKKELWSKLLAYEEFFDKAIKNKKVTALCSYFAGNCACADLADILKNHAFFLSRSNT
jgi:hypothetical protein